MSERALRLAPRFSLPLDAASDVIAILGRRGRGKTTTATVLVEELHAAGHRFCVADPVGVWWGLKSSRDGKGPGIPVVVMGGDRGDVPLEDTAGKVIADFVADPSGPSVVLDFRAFRKAQITRFMTDFLEQLYHRNRAPLHLILDEADQFAPQRVSGDVARLVGAAEDVCKMGRARGLHPIAITQRPAALNKNVLTQAGILIVHGLTGPQDLKAVEAWIHERADEAHRTEVLASLPGLGRGRAWVWAPELEILRQVDVRDRETFDSSATPKGDTPKGPRVQAEVDLDALKVRIASTIEKAKAEDPRELRKTIAELRAAYQPLAADLAPGGGPKEVLAALHRLKAEAAAKTNGKPLLKEAQLKRLEKAIERVDADARGLMTALGAATDHLAQRQQVLVAEAGVLRAALAAAVTDAPKAPSLAARKGPPSGPCGPEVSAVGGGRAGTMRAPAPSRPAPVVSGDRTLGSGELAVLKAVAQYDAGVTREQITLLAGYKKSSRDTYVYRLREAGLVEVRGDSVIVTGAGLAALGPDFERLPIGNALRAHWRGRLPAGELAVFDVVAGAYPRGISREGISEQTGYQKSSRDTYVYRLALRKIVTAARKGGEVRAADELFG